MPGLSAWAVRRPIFALVSWFAALLVLIGLGVGLGGSYNDAFELPDTESKVATDLLSASGTDTSKRTVLPFSIPSATSLITRSRRTTSAAAARANSTTAMTTPGVISDLPSMPDEVVDDRPCAREDLDSDQHAVDRDRSRAGNRSRRPSGY